MKAMIWTRYGPPEVLQLAEIERPAPRDNEALVRVFATTVMVGDCELRSFHFPPWFAIPLRLLIGLRKPSRVKILGQELAGEVVSIGRDVRRLEVGQPVLGASLLRLGTYAEYTCLPESYLVVKPPDITYAQAATLPTGGIYALHLVRSAGVQSGHRVLLVGAGGTIGTYAVQIARAFGAQVEAVDSAAKLDLLRSLGAGRVYDYTQGNYLAGGEIYDAIIDVVGKSSYADCMRHLNPRGRYVLGNPGMLARIRASMTSRSTGKQVITSTAEHTAEGYAALFELISAGKLKAVIDRAYPLEQLVEAHHYVETGQKQGSVVITVNP